MDQSQYGYVPQQEEYYKAQNASVSVEPVELSKNGWTGRKRYYRPAILSTPILAVLLLVALALLGLIEYACRSLPTESFESRSLVGRSVIEARQVEVKPPSVPVVIPTPDSAPPPKDLPADEPQSQPAPATSAANPDKFLPQTVDQTQPGDILIASSAHSDDYLQQTVEQKQSPTAVASANPDNYLKQTVDQNPNPSVTLSANPDLHLKQTVEPAQPQITPPPPNDQPRPDLPQSGGYSPLAADPSSYLDQSVNPAQSGPSDQPSLDTLQPGGISPPFSGAAPLSSYLEQEVTTNADGATIVAPLVMTDAAGAAVPAPVVKINAAGAVTAAPVLTTYAAGEVVPVPVLVTDSEGAVSTAAVLMTDAAGATITAPVGQIAAQGAKGDRNRNTIVNQGRGSAPPNSPNDPRMSRFQSGVVSGTKRIQPTSTNGQGLASVGPNRADRPVVYLSTRKYFVGSYLPTVLAILLRIAVGMVYSSTKMMEPFYCLAEPAGTLAKDFMNINYLSTNDSYDPFLAMFSGHWLMLMVSILYTAVGLLTPFAAELLSFTKFCNSLGDCGPEMRVNPAIGRILQSLLVFSVFMLIGFWWMQRRHKSGIYSDPSSIATMASLLHHPKVIDAFRRIDPNATKKGMEAHLSHHRYRLGSYLHVDGTERYGFIIAEGGSDEYGGGHGPAYAAVTTLEEAPAVAHLDRKRRLNRLRLVRDVIFSAIICGTLIIIVYYFKVGGDSGFEKFMTGEGFGPRFMFTIIGILIHSQWKRIEREVCTMEPFRCLSLGHQPAQSTILIERTLNPITTVLLAIPRRHFFVGLIASVAILAEILIVTLAGIPFNAGQIYIAFRVCSFTSMTILGTMILVMVAVYVRLGRSPDPDLPRAPNTVAAVFSYLCGATTMLDDFADLATLDGTTRTRRVKAMGRTYVLAVGQAQDGVSRWTVDYDDYDAFHS